MSFRPHREVPRIQKRKALGREQVARGALELLDRDGLDRLTMRSLAEHLGVKAASLYRHVRDKADLLNLLADEISGEISNASSSDDWQEQLSEMAEMTRRALLAHRDGARLLAATAPLGPRRLHHIEAVLRILWDAGLTGRDAARAAYHLNNYVTEFAADEARFAETGQARRKMVAEARRHFQSLPADDYPRVRELAAELADDDAEESFRFGLRIWLAGLDRLPRRPSRAPS